METSSQNFVIKGTVLEKYEGKDKVVCVPDGITVIGENAFSDVENLKSVTLPESVNKIEEDAFYTFRSSEQLVDINMPSHLEIIEDGAFSGRNLGTVELPATVKTIGKGAFYGSDELIVYDTIDPEAQPAEQWEFDKWNGTVNSNLSCALLRPHSGYVECQGNTDWRNYHITVKSAETGKILYRIFCDGYERDPHRAFMFSAWGKNASFRFDEYDQHFMRSRNLVSRIEMAFCRIQYPYKMTESHRRDYENYLERCMYLESSAVRTAIVIAAKDSVERLQLLGQYNTIDKHNIEWIETVFAQFKAKKCQEYLKRNFGEVYFHG